MHSAYRVLPEWGDLVLPDSGGPTVEWISSTIEDLPEKLLPECKQPTPPSPEKAWNELLRAVGAIR
jgi:hypothetical protein